MPPLHPGDPGAGHGDDDHGDDDVGFVPPLPPEDRLWRHPSEVAVQPATVAPPAAAAARSRTAGLVLLSGMVGATLALGAVALLGGFDERVVERQVAVRTSALAAGPAGTSALAEQTAPSIAAVAAHRDGEVARGSAIVLRSDGHLLTDASLVAGADRIEVVLHDGSGATARLVGVDDVIGVAVLALAGTDLEPAVVGHSSSLAVGARTVLVGASAGRRWSPTIATGVVSALGQRLEAPDGTAHHGMILLDKAFGADAAGSALIDDTGAVVGIASGLPAGGGSHGVATPIELAGHVADQLIADGRADHVWIGVHGSDLDEDDAAAGMPREGALVAGVTDGGPADRAGILEGDVIVSVDDRATPSMSSLIACLQMLLPGDEVEVGVVRDGELHQMTVVLGARPDDG